jgi:hypothetical protein
MTTRREFLGNGAIGVTGLALGSAAKTYARIVGSNDRVNFAVVGLHGRGYAHLSSIKANKDWADLTHICDVDSRELDKFAAAVQKEFGSSPQKQKDVRKVLLPLQLLRTPIAVLLDDKATIEFFVPLPFYPKVGEAFALVGISENRVAHV